MDKPQLLQDIINNHSDVSIELIQKLAQEEIDRQIKVSIDGMLYKKPLGMLKRLIEYREELILSFREPEIEFSSKEEKEFVVKKMNGKRK